MIQRPPIELPPNRSESGLRHRNPFIKIASHTMDITAARLRNQNSARRVIWSDCVSVESAGGTSPPVSLLSGSVIVCHRLLDEEKHRRCRSTGGVLSRQRGYGLARLRCSAVLLWAAKTFAGCLAQPKVAVSQKVANIFGRVNA
jgi:hypothetical protein